VGRNPEIAIAGGDGTAESIGVVCATVDRVVVLGFEVRVELTNESNGGPFTAQITPRGCRGATAPGTLTKIRPRGPLPDSS